MKNITFYLLLSAAFIFSSCEKKLLYLKPINSENSDTYYEKDDNAFKALVGVYRSTNLDLLQLTHGDLPSDDAVKGGSNLSDGLQFQEVAEFSATSSNPLIIEKWKLLYEAVTRANEVITSIEKLSSLSDNKKIYVAEAKFLRALAYSRLVEVFGRVPLFDHVPLYEEFYNTKRSSTEKAVYDFIKKDLDDAIAALPEKGKTDIGRATTGAARALKARVVMRETGYFYNEVMKARAPEYAGMKVADWWKEVYDQTLAVINSGKYKLLNNYAVVFELEGENGTETVFDQQYVTDLTITGGAPGNNTPVRLGVRGFGGWGFNQPTDNLFFEFSKNGDVDPRREATMLSEAWPVGWGYNIVKSIIMGSKLSEYKWVADYNGYDYNIYKTLRKGVPTSKYKPGGNAQIPTNIRVIRYADVILMNAEAAWYLGRELEARNRVNEIRARARVSTYPPGSVIGDYDANFIPVNYRPFPNAKLPNIETSGDALLQDIWHERRVELALEGIRYYDLIRTGRISRLYNADSYKAKKGLWPLPESEVSIYKLEQNEGY